MRPYEMQTAQECENALCRQGTVALPRNPIQRIVRCLGLIHGFDMLARHKKVRQRLKLGRLLRREPHRFHMEQGKAPAAEFHSQVLWPLGKIQKDRSDYEPKGELAIYVFRLSSAPIDKKAHRADLGMEILAAPLFFSQEQ